VNSKNELPNRLLARFKTPSGDLMADLSSLRDLSPIQNRPFDVQEVCRPAESSVEACDLAFGGLSERS
jgi:hypothetical protein